MIKTETQEREKIQRALSDITLQNKLSDREDFQADCYDSEKNVMQTAHGKANNTWKGTINRDNLDPNC